MRKRLRRTTIIFFVISAVLSQIVLGCAGTKPASLPITSDNFLELQQVQPSPTYMEVVSTDLDSIKDRMLNMPEVRIGWDQSIEFFSPDSDWGGWISELNVEPKLSFETEKLIANPIKLPYQDEYRLLFLVRNAWKLAHDLRVIFLLDFRQISIVTSDGTLPYLDFPAMETQEDRAVEFLLKDLPQGFHQISIILIADPNSTSQDSTYRLLQQKSFFEARYDLWIGEAAMPSGIFAIEETTLGQSAASRISEIELIGIDNNMDDPLIFIETASNDNIQLGLKLSNCGIECRKDSDINKLYDGPVPMRFLVFIDDNLLWVAEYSLLANAPDNLTLNLSIDAPTTVGDHTLNILGVTFPGSSQFSMIQLERLIYPQGIFSRRVLLYTQK